MTSAARRRRDVAAAPPDHAGQLELVVEPLGERGPRDLGLGPDDRVGHSLVVGGDLVPLVGDRPPEAPERALQVALEGQEVAQRARAQRGQQPGAVHLAALALGSAGLDEGDHVAVEAEVDDRSVLERPHPRARAGVIGHEPHAAALCTAASIFT